MTTCSTHVLDAALGRPAVGLEVVLTGPPGSDGPHRAMTDADGRVRFDLGDGGLAPGTHDLVFATGPWFDAAGRASFFPEVRVVFRVGPDDEHHHVAVLLSPFSYTAYRGS